MTKQKWERLVSRQERLKDELGTGFEMDERKILNEILEIEKQLVLIEN